MACKVTLPSGVTIDVTNGGSVEEIRAIVQAAGLGNVAGAPATRDQAGNVRFGEPAGGGKA